MPLDPAVLAIIRHPDHGPDFKQAFDGLMYHANAINLEKATPEQVIESMTSGLMAVWNRHRGARLFQQDSAPCLSDELRQNITSAVAAYRQQGIRATPNPYDVKIRITGMVCMDLHKRTSGSAPDAILT